MAKVSGSYQSVVRGVSEQVPQDRRPGQHYEQVNMISDPVRGLARRHGSIMQDEEVVAAYDEATHTKWLADTAQHKVFTFFVGGVEYDIIYRSKADSQALGSSTFAFAFNKTTKQIMPVVLGSSTTDLVAGGVSAIVNVGKYIFLAGNTVVPSYTSFDKWNATANRQKQAVWIRGGAYAKTYSVTITKAADGTKITKSYKTKSSSYQGTLTTSDILTSDPDYQKKVNDRVYAYQTAVTQWIGQAAEDITPENIAEQLRLLFAADGIVCGRSGGTLWFDDPVYNECAAEDGGDGTLIRAVGGEVTNTDMVSIIHYAGKIVKVRPKKNNGSDALYLLAVAKDGASTGWAEVTWKECAGYEMTPTSIFGLGTVVSNTLYIGGTPAELASMSGDATPAFKKNEVGDDITCPLPYFMGKKIDYLGLFQDRLILGSGATLFFSRPGDYFNWFRASVLSQQDNDPMELYALGSEDDTIKTSTTYDRDLLLFGKRKQYTVNGRQPLTPKTGNIVIMSSHEDAVDAEPVNSGNFVFYAKSRNGITSIHQIQVGQLVDSPESFAISQQLDRYIKGTPVEILAVTSPNTVLIRTTDKRNVLYTYAYLDTSSGSERLFDSWSRWEWNSVVGDIIGMSRQNGDIFVYLLREGLDKDGNHKVWFGCDRFVLDTSISPHPYVDSLRATSSVLTPTANSFISTESDFGDFVRVAYGQDVPTKSFIGTDMDHVDTFLEQYPTAPSETYTGVNFDAFVTPTNPYIRDQQGKAIVVGRLTIGRVNITMADSAGLYVDMTTANGTVRVTDFSGRLLGRSTNLVGRTPIVSTSISAPIGKETREFTYTVSARSWLPLTVTAIEWVGQYFNNARRV